MADKPRGQLANINWNQSSNATSINVKRPKTSEPNNNHPSHPPPASQQGNRHSTNDSSSSDDEVRPSIQLEYERNRKPQTPKSHQPATAPKLDVPIADIPLNRYAKIVAPVKSGKQEKPQSRLSSAHQSAFNSNQDVQRGSNRGKSNEENLMFLTGFLGSMKIPVHIDHGLYTGIGAIQKPMSQLYFPYRQNRQPAEERVLNLESEGLDVRYMESSEDGEYSSFVINWKDILYVEPLKFTTTRQKSKVLSAFEPCESHRNSMLGNKMKLFHPMSKEFKHISLMEHPALLTMVVRDPYGRPDQLFSHGYVASTVEEAVYISRRMRQYIEEAFIASQGQSDPNEQSLNGYSNEGYQQSSNMSMNSYMSTNSNKAKLMAKKGKQTRNRDSQHSGNQSGDTDLGSFHFGMSMLSNEPDSEDEEIADAVRTNFHIGPRLRTENRQQSNQSGRFSGSMMDEDPPESGKSFSSRGQPVGVVQPQMTNLRNAYKVLPSQPADKNRLRPTGRQGSLSEIAPDMDLIMRHKQTTDNTPMLSSLQPRTVVNPLAESEPGAPARGFVSTSKMGAAAAMSSLPFQSGNALPQSAWHESVIGNFQKKEKIDKRNFSQSVDPKALPKLGNEKKEKEIASLFENTDISSTTNQSNEGGSITGLHEAMGFLP